MLIWLFACEPEPGTKPEPQVVVEDRDEDGVTAAEDCDDGDPARSPVLPEVCDGRDNDCDDTIDDRDDSLSGAPVWYEDLDLDGAGGAAVARCDGAGLLGTQTDCDDADPAVHPGAAEGCDGVDSDCDGLVDADDPDWDPAAGTSFYADLDGDTYGDAVSAAVRCAPSANEVSDPNDCDDTDAAVHPGAAEICDNGIDDNCDGAANGCGWSGSGSTNDADAEFLGGRGGDVAGYSLELPGDLGGDPGGDLVITATELSAGVKGKVYLVFEPSPGNWDLSVDADVQLNGAAADDWFGMSTDVADVDGDGALDVLVGALQDDRGAVDAGGAYLFYGPFSPGSIGADDADLILSASSDSAYAGYDVAVAGDTNGDGVVELLVGAAGLNTADGGAFLVDAGSGERALESGVLLSSTEPSEMGGSRVIGLSDLDGDGLDDIGVGGFYYQGGTGRFYLFYGPVPNSVELNTADVILDADAAVSNFGLAVDSADIDHDGRPDLAFGSPLHSGGAVRGGAVHVVHSPIPSGTSTVSRVSAAAYMGHLTSLGAGGSLGLGDVDGDGEIDLVIGASGYDTYAGAGFLVLGPFTNDNLGNAAASWRSTYIGGIFGTAAAVGYAGDDDLADFVIGGPYASPPGRSTSGGAWLYFGAGG